MARTVFALVLPVGTFVLQAALWERYLSPYAWFLFVPAIFLASWVGGLVRGLAATLLSAVIVWWWFVPPAQSLDKEPRNLVQLFVFLTMGVLFSLVHGRMAQAKRRKAVALKEAEEANVHLLRVVDERRLFQALVENSSDFIGIADPQGRPMYVNPAGRRMVGLTTEYPVETTSIPEYYPPELRPFVEGVIVKAMVEQGQWRGETQFRHWRTQEKIPVSDEHFMIRDPQSHRLLGMGTVTRDISDLKRAHDELAAAHRSLETAHRETTRLYESAQRFQAQLATLVERAPEGIFIADLDGRYTDVNRAGCQLLGYSREELIGKTIVELIPPDEVDRLLESKAQMLEGKTHAAEWHLRRKDGALVPVEVSATILPDGRWQGFVRDITERREAQRQLIRSQERYELALRGADLGAWDWNVATGEVIFNARWARVRGYAPEEVRPHFESWREGVHPDDWPRVHQALADHFEGRSPEYRVELRVKTKRGDFIWLLASGRVFVRDAQGKPSRMVGTELDITERKKLEEALRFSEAKSTGILMTVGEAIVSVDEGQRIRLFNERAERVFGYPRQEMMGAPLARLFPQRLREEQVQQVARFLGSEATVGRMGEGGADFWGLRQNGEEFPTEASISQTRVGDKTFLTLALREVTEQRRLERHQRFLAETGPLLAATLDYEQTLSAIAELAVRELADLVLVDVVDEQGHTRRLKALSRDPSKRWVCDGLTRISLDSGRPFITRLPLSQQKPLFLPQVTEEDLEGLAQDATHLRALRAMAFQSLIAVPLIAHGRLYGALGLGISRPSAPYDPLDLQLAEELGYRAALAIENARLYLSARRAVQARDDMLSVVAHDLRNPLNALALQARALTREQVTVERAQRAVESIQRSTARMNRLIEDLLDVTRMEAGRLSIQRTPLAPAEVVLEVVHAQRALAQKASLELRTQLSPGLPEVWADRDRLHQVLENLIGNAVKFTPAQGRVTVGAQARPGEVLFWVADTGVGIAAEHLPVLFDRFWQLEKGKGGAGLGLPIVKGLVDAHGGQLWVQSVPGEGSTFYFTLPTGAPAAPWPPEHLPAGLS